jgi:hypothetical protein
MKRRKDKRDRHHKKNAETFRRESHLFFKEKSSGYHGTADGEKVKGEVMDVGSSFQGDNRIFPFPEHFYISEMEILLYRLRQ